MSSSFNDEKAFLATLEPARAEEFIELKNDITLLKYVKDLFYLVLVLLILYVSKVLKKYITTYLSTRHEYFSLLSGQGEDVEARKEETSKRLHGKRLRLRQFMLDNGFTQEEAENCEETVRRLERRAIGREDYSDVQDNCSPV